MLWLYATLMFCGSVFTVEQEYYILVKKLLEFIIENFLLKGGS